MKTRRQLRDAKRSRSRRIRALLAGGLVLGVGAAATLAAWNDSEYGSGTFTAGTFDIVGSTTGSDPFTSHATSGGAAALSVSLPVGGMAPGNTVYVLFAVKTAPGSVKGKLDLTVASSTGTLGPFLTYGAKTIAALPCNAGTYGTGTTVVPDGTAMSTTGTPASQLVGAAGADQVNYCFAVTLPAGAGNGAQGQSLEQKWLVTGAST